MKIVERTRENYARSFPRKWIVSLVIVSPLRFVSLGTSNEVNWERKNERMNERMNGRGVVNENEGSWIICAGLIIVR